MKNFLLYTFILLLYYILYGYHRNARNTEIIWGVCFILMTKYAIKNYSSKTTSLYITLLLLIPQTRAIILMMLFILGCLINGNIFAIKHADIYRYISNIQITGSLHIKPTIMLVNYPAGFFEYLICYLLTDKIAIVCSTIASKYLIPLCRGIPIIVSDVTENNNFNRLLVQVEQMIKKGYNILVYPERNWKQRPSIYHTTCMKSGIFKIAQKLHVTITPIVIDHFNTRAGVLLDTNFYISIDQTRYVIDAEQEMKNVTKFFQRSLRKMAYSKII